MPLLDEQIDFVRKELGAELWTYGFHNNRHVVDKFLDYHYQQGLSSRRNMNFIPTKNASGHDRNPQFIIQAS